MGGLLGEAFLKRPFLSRPFCREDFLVLSLMYLALKYEICQCSKIVFLPMATSNFV